MINEMMALLSDWQKMFLVFSSVWFLVYYVIPLIVVIFSGGKLK